VSCRFHPVIQEHLQETMSFFSKRLGFCGFLVTDSLLGSAAPVIFVHM
jgi:hypothetical protein